MDNWICFTSYVWVIDLVNIGWAAGRKRKNKHLGGEDSMMGIQRKSQA